MSNASKKQANQPPSFSDEIVKGAERRYGMSMENINKFFDKAQKINEKTAIQANAISAFPQILTYITFPHKDPKTKTDPKKSASVWVKRSGYHLLYIQSGFVPNEDGTSKTIGVPYGPIPRLIVAYITIAALRNKALYESGKLPEKFLRRIHLGSTFAEFIRNFNMQSTGGKRGYINSVKKQMDRLFSSSIKHHYKTDVIQIKRNRPIVKDEVYWWSEKRPDQMGLMDSYVELDQDFFENITQYSFPVDMRVLVHLKGSSLALDYYFLFVLKLQKITKITDIPWRSLHKQFGADFNNVHDFKTKSKKQIRKVLQVYPNAKVDLDVDGNLRLHPSPSHVPKLERK